MKDFFEQAANRETVGSALPDGSTVRFVLTEPDATWVLRRIGPRVELGAPEGQVDCDVRCTTADFVALADGSLDPLDGYRSGRIRVTGDVGIVLDLRKAVLEP